MPLLAKFQEAHPGEADRFLLVGFHDPTVADLEDLDRKAGPLRLPFPQLTDPSGETVRSFGVDEYPTLILIDPEGRVLKAGNEAVLPDLLDRLERALAP